MRVSGAGGVPQVLTKLAIGEATHRWPQVLPANSGVLLHGVVEQYGALRHCDAHQVVDMDGGSPRVVARSASHGRYISSGHILYVITTAPYSPSHST